MDTTADYLCSAGEGAYRSCVKSTFDLFSCYQIHVIQEIDGHLSMFTVKSQFPTLLTNNKLQFGSNGKKRRKYTGYVCSIHRERESNL